VVKSFFKGLTFPAKNFFPEIMELFVSYNVDFIDAYNTVMMQSQDIDLIYSYDSDFDLLENVTRTEP